MARYSHHPIKLKRRGAFYLWACFFVRCPAVSGLQAGQRAARIRSGKKSKRSGVSAKRGRNNTKAGGGGIQPKRQGQGSRQKNLGTKSAKPFRLPKCFGFQKIFRKNFGKSKKGFVSIGRIFGVSGKNLSGVRLFDCYYW